MDSLNLLTENEVRTLITSAVQTEGAILESDAFAILAWAESARLQSTCLDLVLTGKLSIQWRDGEPSFKPVEEVQV